MTREKTIAASEQIGKSFDHTVRESCERIQQAKEREEAWEEKAERVVQAVKTFVDGMIEKVKSIWRSMREFFNSLRSVDKEPDKFEDPVEIHKTIQKEHQEQARLTVSIREHMQYKQHEKHHAIRGGVRRQ